eukprot:1775353-Prymnesium_polylepis.1
MWQGFEKIRRPPYTRATQAPPPAHPLFTRTAPAQGEIPGAEQSAPELGAIPGQTRKASPKWAPT